MSSWPAEELEKQLLQKEADRRDMQAMAMQSWQRLAPTPLPTVKSIRVPIPGFISIELDNGDLTTFRAADVFKISKVYVFLVRGSENGEVLIRGADMEELFDKIACALNLEAAQRSLKADPPVV